MVQRGYEFIFSRTKILSGRVVPWRSSSDTYTTADAPPCGGQSEAVYPDPLLPLSGREPRWRVTAMSYRGHVYGNGQQLGVV